MFTGPGLIESTDVAGDQQHLGLSERAGDERVSERENPRASRSHSHYLSTFTAASPGEILTSSSRSCVSLLVRLSGALSCLDPLFTPNV